MSEAVQQISVEPDALRDAAGWAHILNQQLQAVLAAGGCDRPWLFWEWHNPWSRSAACLDSWAVHDICTAPALIQSVAERIGDNIVLFDTQMVPNPALPGTNAESWQRDADFFPLQGGARGVVVRLPVGAVASGDYLLVRYFPADRKFSRDPLHPAHLELTIRFPWVNYRTIPLWLVAGADQAGNDFVTGFNPKAGRWTSADAAD